MSESIRILVADDHPVLREGLVAVLSTQADFDVVGEAGSGAESVSKVADLSPDVVLLDLEMPEMDGVEAMRRISAVQPEIRFIVLTTYDTDEYIFDAIEAGAKAYLLKDASREELFATVRAVNRGESLIHPSVAAKVLDRLSKLSREAVPASPVSEREFQVLQLMAKGSPNKEIATNLSISESTVKTHVANIFHALDVDNRTEARHEGSPARHHQDVGRGHPTNIPRNRYGDRGR